MLEELQKIVYGANIKLRPKVISADEKDAVM